jgi:hypothetical protein
MKQKVTRKPKKERAVEELMPCILKSSADPLADFDGATGSQVQLSIDSGTGAALIVAVAYAGTNVPGPPFSFVIQTRNNALTILFDDPMPGDTVRLLEACPDGTKNVLRTLRFDPLGPTETLMIKGA